MFNADSVVWSLEIAFAYSHCANSIVQWLNVVASGKIVRRAKKRLGRIRRTRQNPAWHNGKISATRKPCRRHIARQRKHRATKITFAFRKDVSNTKSVVFFVVRIASTATRYNAYVRSVYVLCVMVGVRHLRGQTQLKSQTTSRDTVRNIIVGREKCVRRRRICGECLFLLGVVDVKWELFLAAGECLAGEQRALCWTAPTSPTERQHLQHARYNNKDNIGTSHTTTRQHQEDQNTHTLTHKVKTRAIWRGATEGAQRVCHFHRVVSWKPLRCCVPFRMFAFGNVCLHDKCIGT